jgi:phosphate transport system permease protein
MIKEDRELREGETAPVIFLVSSLQSFATSVTGIPELIYAFAFSGYPNSNDMAWGRLQR